MYMYIWTAYARIFVYKYFTYTVEKEQSYAELLHEGNRDNLSEISLSRSCKLASMGTQMSADTGSRSRERLAMHGYKAENAIHRGLWPM